MMSQNKSDMSMNEILKSIKNFVSVDEEKTESAVGNEVESQPVARAVGMQPVSQVVSNVDSKKTSLSNEDRFLSTEEKMQLLDKIHMPEFMRFNREPKKRNEEANETASYVNQSSEPREQRTEPFAFPVIVSEHSDEKEKPCEPSSEPSSPLESESSGRPGVKAAFQHFANTLEDIVHPKPVLGGLDQMMIEAIQSSVKTWLDQHMQGIVEDLVQREIARITQAILENQ